MGVGKGYVMNWLSRKALFVLEQIVHVDPDFLKARMPEWDGYRELENAKGPDGSPNPTPRADGRGNVEEGTLCHQESAYMMELAVQAAMYRREHVWEAGSLRDVDWYSKTILPAVRKDFPHYRVAVIHVVPVPGGESADEDATRILLERTEARGNATGRYTPRRRADH